MCITDIQTKVKYMTRKPMGSVPKFRTQISVDFDLYSWLKDSKGGCVNNFSAWIENIMRQEKLRKSPLKQCKCGVVANGYNWVKWGLQCPQCKLEHTQVDQRKEIVEMKAD